MSCPGSVSGGPVRRVQGSHTLVEPSRRPHRSKHRPESERSFARFCDLIVAHLAAGFAVVQPVVPEADIELSLAQAAIFFALASLLRLLALTTDDACSGRHGSTLARSDARGNVPLVTKDGL